jgi:hypothetical protein
MVWNDDKLGEVLKILKQGRAHMAFVRGIKENGLVLPSLYLLLLTMATER